MFVFFPQQVVQYFLSRNTRILKDFPKLPTNNLMVSRHFGVSDLDGVPEGDSEVFLEIMERRGAESRFLLSKIFLIFFALEA